MITVVLSAKLFWGFSVEFEDGLESVSIEEQTLIVNARVKQELRDFFGQKNLQILIEEVQKLHLHLHDPLKANTLMYACDHCHNF
jgi:hypothetical protein